MITECTPPGYSFINIPRNSGSRGGGIGMVFKTPLKVCGQNHAYLVYTTFAYAYILRQMMCFVYMYNVTANSYSYANR